jgi:ATP-binding cassette subfamily B protein
LGRSRFQTAGSQRSVYFRDLGLTPPAAKEVRVFGLGEWIVDRFSEHWNASASAQRDKNNASNASVLLVVPIVAVHLAAFLVVLHEVRAGAIDLRTFAVTLQAILGLAVLGVSGRDQVVIAWGTATIPPVWDLEALVDRIALPARSPGRADIDDDTITFDDVTFAYPRSARNVLDRLALDIPSGHSLALVGSNGAGKTTIVKLLCGLLEPSVGSVLIGGIPLRDVDPATLRRRTAVLFQDFIHYPFSAEDNICFGAIEATRDHRLLDRVTERAGLADVRDGLPRGWDTPLSRQFTGGVDLSGGQWQRVALARTLWAVEAGARVLVLDEPTANLDVRAEARFYEQFLELTAGLTTILVSHRFASVRLADTICVLDGGRVAERGTHDELSAAGGIYARMFFAQSEAYETTGPSND